MQESAPSHPTGDEASFDNQTTRPPTSGTKLAEKPKIEQTKVKAEETATEKLDDEEQEMPDSTASQRDEEDDCQLKVIPSVSFHHIYYRNDRRNLQCFPTCGKFAEYRLHHECILNARSVKSYCKLPFEVTLKNLPANVPKHSLLVFARVCEVTCLPENGIIDSPHVEQFFRTDKTSPGSENVDMQEYRTKKKMIFEQGDVIDLEAREMKEYMTREFSHKATMLTGSTDSRTQRFRFNTGNWKYTAKLPKTRLQILTTKFTFQVVVGETIFEDSVPTSRVRILKIYNSSLFKISNTRSLGPKIPSNSSKRDSDSQSASESESSSKKLKTNSLVPITYQMTQPGTQIIQVPQSQLTNVTQHQHGILYQGQVHGMHQQGTQPIQFQVAQAPQWMQPSPYLMTYPNQGQQLVAVQQPGINIVSQTTNQAPYVQQQVQSQAGLPPQNQVQSFHYPPSTLYPQTQVINVQQSQPTILPQQPQQFSNVQQPQQFNIPQQLQQSQQVMYSLPTMNVVQQQHSGVQQQHSGVQQQSSQSYHNGNQTSQH